MKPPETVAGHLHKLTYKDQLILCHCIRTRLDQLKFAHLTPALLPFVRLEDAQLALMGSKAARPVAVLMTKLGPIEPPYHPKLWLVKKSVHRVFGAYPERGRRFNWLPTREVNGKVLDKLVCLRLMKEIPRDDIPYFSAINEKGPTGFYQVITHKLYGNAVRAWAIDNLT